MQCVLGSDAEGYDQVLFHLYKNGSALLVFLFLIVRMSCLSYIIHLR